MHLLSFVLPLAGLSQASPLVFPHQNPVPSLRNSTAHTSANTSRLAAAASSNWWYANIDHTTGAVRDYAPGVGDSNYPIYKSVSNVNDLYNAILSDGPNGSQRPSALGDQEPGNIISNDYLAALPRVVYIAPGTYVLNRKLALTGDTILIGDAANPPVLKASSGFGDPYVIQGGSGITGPNDNGGHGELRFSRVIKNVIIDTTQATGNSDLIALEWGVAQNCALVNVQINMPPQKHTGLYVGQGSTVQVADVGFSYGTTGVRIRNQQVTLKNLKFDKTTNAIEVAGGFAINVLNPSFDTVGVCVKQTNGSPWLSIVDATITNSGTLLQTTGNANFLLENVNRDNNNAMATLDGKTLVGGTQKVGHYVYGNTYGANPAHKTDNQPSADRRPSSLLVNGKYASVTPNQHTDKSSADVLNLKDSTQNGGFTVRGDANNIDGPGLQSGLNKAASAGKIAYLPFGVYRVDQTLTIPPGTILFGNGWSTIQGVGNSFKEESNPRPVVQVGAPGSTGTAEIHDIHVNAGEQLPGAILVQVNMAGAPGDVVIHNSLITLGGTLNTGLSCGGKNNCAAAYLGLHLSSTSSAYINNAWVWVADHAVDHANVGTDTAGKGGVLVEATKGTWLTGLGSEHWWYYNLGYNKASNVFVSMLQSETNYQEGNSQNGSGAPSDPPPGPFTPTSSDPSWDHCNNAPAVCRMTMNQWFKGGSNIVSYASASWNFGDGNVQANVNVIEQTPSNLQLYGLCAGPSTNYAMRLPNGTRFGRPQDGFNGSWQTLVAEAYFK
ncbi:Glucan endo-1,3-beta-glucosidase [Cercospora beticola]|uniref:Glucan endo-1,3-beta-glucosidase n=1 Tax=Cercospora beticola TaxID=122368 RepID=A0A2G5HDZ2_CERBT|nr:Glucan endo-1,3-beta-glucosidase [Cercospora beticola]PIA90493.1 Glucan endo-1,3-beta-glucosidase [Cercospora beticola]WPB08238.1 hypothetical protein RHO25_012903 [Cercospora beticola]